MDDSCERFADLRKIVVDAPMDAGGQQREAFQEPIDMRVVAAIRIEQKPPGDLGILARKLSAHLAQIGQLALIVFQQFFAHGPYFTSYAPLINSSTVSNLISSSMFS